MTGRPINALEIYSRFRNEMQKPDPFRANEVPVDRGFLAPLATYADGQTELAWPSFPVGAVIDGVRSFGAQGFDTPEAIRHNAGAAFDTAGGIVQGGLGVGLAGGLADNAVGSAGAKIAGGAFDRSSLPATAAIKIGDDIFLGKFHGNATTAAVDKYGLEKIRALKEASGQGDRFWNNAEGYQTLGGDFISRRQAAQNIRNSGLAPGEQIPNDFHSPLLHMLRDKGLWSNAPSGSSVPLLQNALERAQPQGIRAYHGSPHDFDRFSLDKIGTGEGAQAYGHGLYFADSEGVARSYRDNLTPTEYRIGDQLLEPQTVQERTARRALSLWGPDVDSAIKSASDAVASGHPADVSEWGPALDQLKAWKDAGIEHRNPGRMYEVNIKANQEDFLDWDKPLSQQSEAVRQAALGIRNAAARKDYEARGFPPELIEEYLGNAAKADKTGGQLVQGMKGADLSSDFSQALREAGIPGIRYLDGMSRGAGEGSSNYVVFDDALVEILRKYANAPTGAAVPLAGETQDTENPLLQYLRMMGNY